MSMTGLEVFDKTVQTTNIWLNEICDELGPDKQRAYHALKAVLHALRDRLLVEEAAHLSAQLPTLIRGLYFEGWSPARQPGRERTREEFLNKVQAEFANLRPMGADEACRAVFSTMERHITHGQLDKVKQALPEDIRRLWPDRAYMMPPPEQAGYETGSGVRHQ